MHTNIITTRILYLKLCYYIFSRVSAITFKCFLFIAQLAYGTPTFTLFCKNRGRKNITSLAPLESAPFSRHFWAFGSCTSRLHPFETNVPVSILCFMASRSPAFWLFCHLIGYHVTHHAICLSSYMAKRMSSWLRSVPCVLLYERKVSTRSRTMQQHSMSDAMALFREAIAAF